uniref:ATP synthase F0 subunit 8 n=1 Tax=Eisenia nordenskioldi nordenskioldi TaxID=1269247 RepID=A0A6B9ITS2_9ANNE|nr:ATP synthase F0 subunit 8 [Eisenia nordenskioldi nordenskioldi]
MPHLSPMSWIFAISTFWAALTMLASTLWWTKNHSFSSTLKNTSPTLDNSWKWF